MADVYEACDVDNEKELSQQLIQQFEDANTSSSWWIYPTNSELNTYNADLATSNKNSVENSADKSSISCDRTDSSLNSSDISSNVNISYMYSSSQQSDSSLSSTPSPSINIGADIAGTNFSEQTDPFEFSEESSSNYTNIVKACAEHINSMARSESEEDGRRVHEDDEGVIEDHDDEEDDLSTMNPLERLLKCAHSPHSYERQIFARSIHETLRLVLEVPEEVQTVLQLMESFSYNDEPTLRTELMEQVPQIAFLCHDYPEKLGDVVTINLVPMVVKFLTDKSDQVRKTSQAALLVLLEQDLVSHRAVHDQVCPVILSLTEASASDEFKTEAVALMSKMSPLVGRDMTERLFVDRFTRLCTDTLFQVRKVCASNFAEFSGVVGMESTLESLLPRFVCLCEDGVWSVRKACADVFTALSCSCPLYTRKERLSPIFISLLTDQSRWVRVAAFQSLGPFISTFADPTVTGLQYNEDGILVVWDQKEIQSFNEPRVESTSNDYDCASSSDGCSSSDSGSKIPIVEFKSCPKSPTKCSSYYNSSASDVISSSGTSLSSCNPCILGSSPSTNPLTMEDNNSLHIQFDTSNDNPRFNAFNYWRLPLPDLNLEEDLQLPNSTSESMSVETLSKEIEKISLDEKTEDKLVEVVPTDELNKVHNVEDKESSAVAELMKVSQCEKSDDEIIEGILSQGSSSVPSNQDLYFCESSLSFPPLPSTPLDEPSDSEGEKMEVYDASNCYYNFVDMSDEKESPKEAEIIDNEQKTYASVTKVSLPASDRRKGTFTSLNASPVVDLSNSTTEEISTSTSTAPSTTTFCKTVSGIGNKSDADPFFPFLTLFSGQGDSVQNNTKTEVEALVPELPKITIHQEIVPMTLLAHYISMTDPLRAETVDNEITRHCAYSLPGVALTLGRQYWPVIRDTYKLLVGNIHWKVRRTLAFSIHELAAILGQDITERDLLPVFEGFIKDLDEVRIGVLKYLSNFVKVLSQEQRLAFIPQLKEFRLSEDESNWRYRLELTLQLAPLSELFTAEECFRYICPIALSLMCDKVVHVRRNCYWATSRLVKKLSEDELCLTKFSEKLEELLARAPTYTKRQSYIYAVGTFVKDGALPLPLWCSLYLQWLIQLSKDKVPNIRMAIAKIINSNLLVLDYFHNTNNESSILVQEMLERLRDDCDRDVKYFASYPACTDVGLEFQETNFY